MEEAEAAAPSGDGAAARPLRPSIYANLRFLKLIAEADHSAFFAAVAQLLRGASSAAELSARFSLPFNTTADTEAGELFLAVKAVLCRVAARSYADPGAKEALCSDITAAGLSPPAAEWTCSAAEAAVAPCASEIRCAQAHAAAALSSSYLEDFDWQARTSVPRGPNCQRLPFPPTCPTLNQLHLPLRCTVCSPATSWHEYESPF